MQVGMAVQCCVASQNNPAAHSPAWPRHISPSARAGVQRFETLSQYTSAESAHSKMSAHDSPAAGNRTHFSVVESQR